MKGSYFRIKILYGIVDTDATRALRIEAVMTRDFRT